MSPFVNLRVLTTAVNHTFIECGMWVELHGFDAFLSVHSFVRHFNIYWGVFYLFAFTFI